MFSDLKKTVEESSQRWNKIEQLKKDIQNPTVEVASPEYIERLATMMIMLVDHMRPMNPSTDQLDEATRGIEDLLKNLK